MEIINFILQCVILTTIGVTIDCVNLNNKIKRITTEHFISLYQFKIKKETGEYISKRDYLAIINESKKKEKAKSIIKYLILSVLLIKFTAIGGVM